MNYGAVPSSDHASQMARFREALARKRWTQRDLSREAKIGENLISDFVKGSRDTKASNIAKMCDALGINEAWLLYGMGPMLADGAPEQAAEPQQTEERPAVRRMTPDAPMRPVSLGIDRWLADTAEGRATTDAEREWMRAVPWPTPHMRYPDIIYATVLAAYRQAISSK